MKDFILDVKLHQTGKKYGHRDMCVFYNFKDCSSFYYTHIVSVTDKTHIIVLLCVMNRVLKFHIKQARDIISLFENGMIYVLFVKINQGKSKYI